MLALAADHVILDVEEFRATCLAGLEAAQAGTDRHLRHHADRAEDQLRLYPARRAGIGPKDVFAVEAFVEKPDAETAARYVAEGYLWNSGNFLFRADVLLEELRALRARRWPTAVEAAVAGGQRPISVSCGSTPRRSRARRRSRSTTR